MFNISALAAEQYNINKPLLLETVNVSHIQGEKNPAKSNTVLLVIGYKYI